MEKIKEILNKGLDEYESSHKIVGYNKDDKKREEHVADCIKDNKKRIAFFRTKDALGIELYRFVGVFHLDTDATRKKGKCIWHRESNIYEL